MNRGQIFYSSLVQQMIGSGGEQGNNNSNSNLWIDMNSSGGSGGGGGGSRPGLDEENIAVGAATTLSPLSHHPYHTPPSSYFLPVMAPPWSESNSQEQPESLSLSQLLLSGLSEEERYAYTIAAAQSRKMENNWGDDNKPSVNNKADHHQYGAFNNGAVNGSNQHHEESMQQQGPKSQWNHQQLLPASSPRSCITTTSLGSNLLDFSNCLPERRPHQSDNSSECNSTATGSALKKARVQVTSSAQSTLKVRKERLGDRITALHQIVSPFGKTDTASVLQETIGYIKFLISQIEALTTPYMGSSSSAAPSTAKPMQMQQQQQPLTLTAQGERNCLFPEYPRQVHQGGSKEEQASTTMTKDLKSRGLCLVPVSCTSHLGTDTSADYWPFGR